MGEIVEITERTPIKVPLASWIHVILIVATMVGCYLGLKYDIQGAIEVNRHHTEAINEIQKQTVQMRMDIQGTQQEIKFFHKRFEDLANKYFRDYDDPARRMKQ